MGLGRQSTANLSWDRTMDRLANLGRFARDHGVRICLENLAWGWTSRPHLFEKMLRITGLWATLDLGHARVSPEVMSRNFDLDDFVSPHPERFLGAHIYHEDRIDETHLPPETARDVEERLNILLRLPACNWWLLELREERPLLKTLDVVLDYFRLKIPGFGPAL